MRRGLRGPADYEVCFGALPLPTGEGGRRPGEGHKVREYCAPHPALRATFEGQTKLAMRRIFDVGMQLCMIEVWIETSC